MRRVMSHLLVLLVLSAGAAAADEWQELSPSASPSPRAGHSMTTLADGVYLFGGIASGSASDELWRWDHDSGTWRKMARSGSWPAPRAYHGAVEWEGDLIVMGGASGGTVYDDVWRYRPGDGWSVLVPGKIQIFESFLIATLVVLGVGILIAGGYIQGDVAGRLLRIVPGVGLYGFVFLQNDNPLLRRYGMVLMGFWLSILVMLGLLVAGPAEDATMDTVVYAFGGADQTSYTDDLVRIDALTGEVERVDVAGATPSARIWPAHAGWGPSTFLFGGEGDGVSRLGDAWRFDAGSVSFERVADMPVALSDAAAAVIPSQGPDNRVQLIVFGGFTGQFQAENRTFLYTSDVAYASQPVPDLGMAAVARAQGLGVFFLSRWSLYNAGDVPLELALKFTPRGGGAADQMTSTHQLGPGRLEEVEDPLAAFFGLSGDAVGSVLIEVVAGDPGDLVLHSVIIARQADGAEYNQFFPAVPFGDSLAAGDTAYLFTTENPGRNRVNAGVMAFDDGTEVRVTPVQPLGRVLGDPRTFMLDRGGNVQINNIHREFGLGSAADVMLRLEVLAGRATGYVSVLDGVGGAYPGTSDPTTIAPIVSGSTSVVLLEIGPVQGLNEFAGSGSLVNFAPVDASVRADFYRRGVQGVSASATIQLPAGTAVGHADLVSELVGLDDAVGTLVLSSTGGRRFGAVGREFAVFRDGAGDVVGTAGQPMPGLTPDHRLLEGRTAHFIGLRQAGAERSHIAFFNPGADPLTFSVRAFGDGDVPEGEVVRSLAGEALIQVNNILREANPQVDGGVKRLEVTVDRPCYVLAFRVNPTGDPITIPPAVR